jgi:hypothetical protein
MKKGIRQEGNDCTAGSYVVEFRVYLPERLGQKSFVPAKCLEVKDIRERVFSALDASFQ